ncbi:MAG: winged helix-turn-helix transcriptional regulator [Candidatus Aenigmarchaeota archaeon]|nr:winged helix-turn-helix transcriptional regulator [Candidatus Aenigmarchaeota archaeon]
MNKEKSLLLEMLGSSPEMRIIDFFLDNKLFDFSKKEIIEETGMSKATFYKHWDRLEGFGIVKISRKFGKAKLYQINRGNPLVEELFRLEKQLITTAADRQEAPITVQHSV